MTGTPASPADPSPAPAYTRRRHHIEMLILSLVVVAASFTLTTGEGSSVEVAGQSRWRLPPLCASKALFNVECPGCGLTRGFVHLAHGRLHESLQVNRVAWLIALALVASIPYRILALWRNRALPLGTWAPRILGWVLITALIGNWLLKVSGV